MTKEDFTIFFTSNDENSFITLNDKGFITSTSTVKIKIPNKKLFKYKKISASKIYAKNILEVYKTFFEYELDNEHNKNVVKYFKELHENYIKPQLKNLTEEEIQEIHARGKITPAEKIREWESLDLCAPGDSIGSAAWRCDKFKCCHDCLVDYANNHEEYTSFADILKEARFSINIDKEEKQSEDNYQKVLKR